MTKSEQLTECMLKLSQDRTFLINALKLIYNCHDVSETTHELIESTLEKVTRQPKPTNETKP